MWNRYSFACFKCISQRCLVLPSWETVKRSEISLQTHLPHCFSGFMDVYHILSLLEQMLFIKSCKCFKWHYYIWESAAGTWVRAHCRKTSLMNIKYLGGEKKRSQEIYTRFSPSRVLWFGRTFLVQEFVSPCETIRCGMTRIYFFPLFLILTWYLRYEILTHSQNTLKPNALLVVSSVFILRNEMYTF